MSKEPLAVDLESSKLQIDSLLEEHHNGYDESTCVSCGADWYNEDGHRHLTNLVITAINAACEHPNVARGYGVPPYCVDCGSENVA